MKSKNRFRTVVGCSPHRREKIYTPGPKWNKGVYVADTRATKTQGFFEMEIRLKVYWKNNRIRTNEREKV